jgi:hypothetical protein
MDFNTYVQYGYVCSYGVWLYITNVHDRTLWFTIFIQKLIFAYVVLSQIYSNLYGMPDWIY